ncbi:MAG: type I restriction enzyme HsdR N-terminal domain-containing protein [Balneolaceae bacterium]|nr:type I restriction enzyme HsdR N-terminal domain-containing protein [Balneolaceae bacterium]
MQPSVASRQFPQIIWKDGKKQLWNPIHRKRLKNRPEERVRLRIIEYLINGGWSKHRISTEEAIASSQKETSLRTDLICYTQQFKPFLLVECKAEQVKITGQTADQIARYNQDINAPYLLMTNGLRDFWYGIKSKNSVSFLDAIPDQFPGLQTAPEQSLAYWTSRGFAGDKAAPGLRKWLEQTLNNCFLDDQSPRFLSFNNSPSDLDLNNYYIIRTQSHYKLALSFSSTPFGGSRLVGIVNREGQNIGVLEINLDLLFDDRAPNASFYDSQGTENIDAISYLKQDSESLHPDELLEQLHPLLQKLIG